MEIWLIILCLSIIPTLVIDFIVAMKFQDITYQKGYDRSMHSFTMCFWLGIIGYLYVIALPDLNIYRLVEASETLQSNEGTNLHSEADTSNAEKFKDPYTLDKMYNSAVMKAEKFKDTFYDRNYRIRTYESIVKNMEILANENYKDSALKLEEYASYLEMLKSKKIINPKGWK